MSFLASFTFLLFWQEQIAWQLWCRIARSYLQHICPEFAFKDKNTWLSWQNIFFGSILFSLSCIWQQKIAWQTWSRTADYLHYIGPQIFSSFQQKYLSILAGILLYYWFVSLLSTMFSLWVTCPSLFNSPSYGIKLPEKFSFKRDCFSTTKKSLSNWAILPFQVGLFFCVEIVNFLHKSYTVLWS